MIKVHLKSFTFGMGIGIITLSLIFLTVLNITNYNNEPIIYSEEEIIEMAQELGMVFEEDKLNINDALGNEINTQDPDDTDDLIQDTTYREDVVINITYGTPAIDIAEVLYNENIISDPDDFNNYLIAAGFSNRLKAGNLTFKTDSTFEEATSVLIGRNLLPQEIPY